MVYFAVVDISQLSDIETDTLREKIKKHFIKTETLKRKESVAAKALLTLLMRNQYGITNFTVDCDKDGKPFIVGSEISFNLSHSGNYALCALSDKNVGCDIQQITPCNQRVARRFFTQNEIDSLEICDDKDIVFTKMWALKESALKFCGKGMSGGLDRYDFSEYYNKNSFTLQSLCFNVLEIPDYVVSICSESASISQLNADIKKDF